MRQKLLIKKGQAFKTWVKKNRFEFSVAVLILLIASFMRLYRIADYLTFLGDEGRDVLVVKRIIVDHKWTLLGPTASVGGFFLGPLYYYFMIPFLWLWGLNPVGPAVMVALFGILTVFLVYKAGRDFFGYQVGLLAAGLYAISPLVISYSRSSWNPNLMPFFSLLIVWLTRKLMVEKNLKLLILIGFSFGILIQLHYLATFLMAVIGLYLFVFSPFKKQIKFYLWPLLGFLAGWSPFLLFELRHRFPNFYTLCRFLLYGEETGFVGKEYWPEIKDIVFRLFNRLVTNNQTTLALLLLWISLILFAYFWWRARKDKKLWFTYSLLGFWLILGVALFLFYQDEIYDYYFGFMFPLPFLLSSLALVKIGKANRLGFFLAGLLSLWLVVVNFQGIPFRYEPNRQLNQTKQIAEIVLREAEGKPFNFALITGNNSDHAYRYFLEIKGYSPVTIENPQVDPERKSVTDQLLVVCESSECHPLGHSLWEIAGFGRAEIMEEWSAPAGIKVVKLKHYQEN